MGHVFLGFDENGLIQFFSIATLMIEICIDCIDQWKLINRTRSSLFQISVSRSFSEDGFKEGLENAYGIQCSCNDWVDADKWTPLENEDCTH